MNRPFRIFCTLFALATVFQIHIQANDSISYRPNIHGVIRGRFEASTVQSDYRFQVRNARVTIDGKIAPVIDYFIQTDFCDRGSIKILDVWARLWATKGLGIQAGQFRMPFGVDPFRAPHNYFFANRSFIGNQICNYRAVGAKVIWQAQSTPLTIEAGAFNPATISDHVSWHNKLAYAAKATYKIHNISLATGFMSVSPDSVRSNIIDGAVTWESGRWRVEGEYMYKHYTRSRHKEAHGYNIYADYHMPIKAGIFNRLSFQGRFDGMTAHSNSIRDKQGQLTTNHPARNRATIGTTISYIRSKNMYLDIRANYEKYFYHSGVNVTPDMGDKAVVELVLRF